MTSALRSNPSQIIYESFAGGERATSGSEYGPGREGVRPGPDGTREDVDASRESETIHEADASSPRSRTLGLVVVDVIALLAGTIATVTGEFNTATVLFWVCVPTVYGSLRSRRSAEDPTGE